ncbi:hypothetical protein AAHB59_13350 [Bacillus cereus]
MFDDLPSIGESPDSSLNDQIQKDEIKLFGKAHETPDKYHLDGTGSDEITRLIYDNQGTYHWNNKKFSNVEIREKMEQFLKVSIHIRLWFKSLTLQLN